MDYFNYINKFKNVMSGDTFIDLFIMPVDNSGRLAFTINDVYGQNCPSNSKCTKQCYSCWKKYLQDIGYIFDDKLEQDLLKISLEEKIELN